MTRTVAQTWSLFGECRAFDVRAIPDVLRPMVSSATPLAEPTLILHDPAIPAGENWLRPWVTTGAAPLRFLQWFTHDQKIRFYVPATSGTGFPSDSPLYEGHWRDSLDDESDLPWPAPGAARHEQSQFIEQLDRVEAMAFRVAYRGRSMCRLCGQTNGHEGLRLERWEWPAGYRHYLAAHSVQPTVEFNAFIRNRLGLGA